MSKVSIIIPAYNSESTIKSTIYSCLNQTYEDIEIIVIDDGSSDSTGDIVRSIEDSRIKYNFYENQGRSIARNTGLKLASGKYIQFLDSDDTIDSKKIERAIHLLEGNSTIDAVQCGTKYWKKNQLITKMQAKSLSGKKKDKLLLRKNLFPIHSVIFKKELAAQYPEKLSYCEDWYFWVKTLLNANVFTQIDYYGANVFVHENNTMTDHRNMLLGEFYILVRIKKEVNSGSLIRDLKIMKQYVNYCLKYGDEDINNLSISVFKVVPYLKYTNYIINSPKGKRVLKKIVVLKNKILKKEQVY
ncbi:glycosyltransferase family 2 protein [Bacillus mycoides]|uniref:glycosyltransferase family 2 protein n=1 Tax=Bacillus mycoides TaxID=1405 RepID=UPI001C02A003|nr:glycosyltransferase family 2 protein [Bacillus mycoides]QWH63546.1 glycosyltransferase family 2 protein [Bacillus mycoides]